MAKRVIVGERVFPSIASAEAAVKAIWNAYELNSPVTKLEDHDFLYELVLMHPNPPAKIGAGIDYFKVVDPSASGQWWHHGVRAVSIVRVDDTEEEFSALKVLRTPQSPFQALCDALSNEAQEIAGRHRESKFAAGPVTCPVTGQIMSTITEAEARRTDPPLAVLVARFLHDEGLELDTIAITNVQTPEARPSGRSITGPVLSDPEIRERWLGYQEAHIEGFSVVHKSAPRKRSWPQGS